MLFRSAPSLPPSPPCPFPASLSARPLPYPPTPPGLLPARRVLPPGREGARTASSRGAASSRPCAADGTDGRTALSCGPHGLQTSGWSPEKRWQHSLISGLFRPPQYRLHRRLHSSGAYTQPTQSAAQERGPAPIPPAVIISSTDQPRAGVYPWLHAHCSGPALIPPGVLRLP